MRLRLSQPPAGIGLGLGLSLAILMNTNYTDVVWGSDINWDMKRKIYFASRVKEIVDRLGLVPLWAHHPVDFTHVHTDNKSLSTLDHFLLTPRLLPLVVSCGALHRGDNLSRHSPVWLTLDIGTLPLRSEVNSFAPRRPAWSKASEENILNYTMDMQTRLSHLHQPDSFNCQDPHCQNMDHSKQRDTFMLDILCNLVESSYTRIPMTGGRHQGDKVRSSRGGLPGWQEEVEPFRQESMFWHNSWLKEGRPSQGWLHGTMVLKRTQNHFSVRRLKRRVHLIKAKKHDMDLLKEMRNIKSGRDNHTELPDNVEGASGENDIASKFREVYSTLYNSSGSKNAMEVLRQEVQSLIGPDSVKKAAVPGQV